MSTGELLYRTALVVAGVSGGVGLVGWRWHQARWVRALWASSGITVAALCSVAMGVRWWEAGHLPLFGTYESALSLAAAVVVVALVAEGKGRFALGLAPVAALVAAGVLAHGLGYDRTAYALTISERSWVVDVHAVIAWLAFGALTANAAVALRALFFGQGDGTGWLSRTLELGFLLHSAMMASGSIYKFLLFGKAWSFDPIEILGLIAWLAYATLLHLHLLAGWHGRRLAAWCLALFVVLIVSYRGIVYFPSWSTYHIFDMDLRQHVVH